MKTSFENGNQAPPTLYHCLYKQPEGDALLPLSEREVNGSAGKFLFAADHLSKALAFAFSYHDREVLMNAGIAGVDEEFVLVCGGQATLDKERSIRVYSFSGEGFEELEGARQWVSENPMPFDQTQLVLETNSINDLMRKGLQIFLLPEEFGQEEQEALQNRLRTKSYIELIAQMRRDQNVRWINEERGVNVSNTLSAQMKSVLNGQQKRRQP